MAWMSEEQAATALGVSFRTIRRRVGNGSLRSMRQGSDLLVDVEVACKPGRRAIGDPPAADKPEIVPAILPIDLPSTAPEGEPAPPADLSGDAPRTLLPPRTFTPTGFALPRAPQSIHPAHALPLTPASATTSPERKERSCFGPSMRRTSPQAGRWMGPVIWSLVTVALCGVIGGVWLVQQSRIRIGDLESKLGRALTAARKAQTDHEKQMQAQAATANTRGSKLQNDLSAARADVDRLALRLRDEERDASALKASLAEATARIASLDSQQEDLSRKLAIARVSVAVLNGRATLADSLYRVASRLEQGWTAARVTASAGPTTPVLEWASERQSRRLPPAPPTLGEEDLAVGLHRIVEE